jgi:hypothetical protein
MTIPKWADITREERYFTARLFGAVSADARPFWTFLHKELIPQIDCPENIEIIDVGFEVCLFRDFAYYSHISLKSMYEHMSSDYMRGLLKQTFDIVLTLSNDSLVIIEAKAHQCFSTTQMRAMHDARDIIRGTFQHLGIKNIYLAGLHSGLYNPQNIRSNSAFENLTLFTWQNLVGLYPAIDCDLRKANMIYANNDRP